MYLRELGYTIPNGPGILDITRPPRKEELEDAYAKYAYQRILLDKLEKTAFPNTSQPEPFYTLNVTMGLVPVDQLRKVSQQYNASVTEYLTAVLLQSLLENQAARHYRHPRPVALAIPINLRPWFPSETLRNFILTVRPCIDPTLGEYTLEEIVRQVHSYMRLHANRQEMQAKLTGNVQFTKNRFFADGALVSEKIQSWHFPTNWLAFVPILGPTPILESFTFPRNGTPHPSHGSDVGTSHTPLPPLRLHQLRQYHGHHLRWNRGLQRNGAAFFLPSGAGRDPCQGGVQPYPLILLRGVSYVLLRQLRRGTG